MPPGQQPPPIVTVSWAKVEPERGEYDDEALETLARRLRGAAPGTVVVLHAGALPDWVMARHGWLDADILAPWSCYVDRVAQRVGVFVDHWCPIRGPLDEAEVYGDNARIALRTLLDAHAAAYLHTKRTQGRGGVSPAVGSIVSWAAWRGAGIRGRAEAALLARLGPEAWIDVLKTGKLRPPFAPFGELSNGSPALDWVAVDWLGAVELPGGKQLDEGEAAREAVWARLTADGLRLLWG